jgi:hypothetical protein
MIETQRDLNLAVLIDADNVPYANVKEMFEEIAKYGTPTFKRIYADCTKPTVYRKTYRMRLTLLKGHSHLSMIRRNEWNQQPAIPARPVAEYCGM